MSNVDELTQALELLAARAAASVFLPPGVIDLVAERKKRQPPSRSWLREHGYLPPAPSLLELAFGNSHPLPPPTHMIVSPFVRRTDTDA